MWVDFDVRGQQEMDLLTGGSIIMDYGFMDFVEKQKLKHLNNGLDSFKQAVFHFTMLTDGLESC